ncbi:uncharacterized protein [Lepeophtheirus salmonis]|uniref:uncharacterized protein n=1 Tax=Lepeophtheirus salmonis TaxID=72036 RepID=UPI001AE2E144|nr:uncharacterized protein LOC121130015 isoform X1 [Lepeophtheirus salmonis]
MKSFAICTFVLCSTISINAGPFLRRTRRDSPPVSSYGGEQVGAASSSGADSTSFGGSAGGVVAGGSSSTHLAKHVPIPFSGIAEVIAAQIPFATQGITVGPSATAIGSPVGFGGSVAADAAVGLRQSFSTSFNSRSVSPLSSYGRK